MTNNINYSRSLNTGYDRQTITITDLLSEGPIQGLVNGRAGVFLNNDRIVSVEEAGRQYNTTALTITLTNGSDQATINNSSTPHPIRVESNDHGLFEGIRGLWIRGAATKQVVATVTNESNLDYITVVTSDNSNFFIGSMATNVYQTGHQYTPVRLRSITGTSQTIDSIPFEGRLFKVVSNTTAKLFPSSNGISTGALVDNGTYIISVDSFVSLSASSGTTLTLSANWAGATGEYKFDDNGLLVQQGGTSITPGTPTLVGQGYNQKYESAQVAFRTGTADQAPLPGESGEGTFTVQNSIGHTIEQATTFSGSQAPLVLTGSSSSAAGFNLSSSQILEIDELRIFFDYPGGFKRVDSKGTDKFTYQVYKISISVKRPGESSFETEQTVDQNYAQSGTFNNAVTFIKSIELDRYRPFIDFQIKIERQTAHNGAAYYDTVASRKRYHNDTNVTTGAIKQVVSIVKERLNYPYSAIAKVAFSSKQFQNLPQRTYHLQGIKLKVPKNYVTREEADDGIAGYYRKSDGTLDANKVYQDWDGSFREGLIYSNNPAWILNDIVTNNRYGLGDFVSQFDVDKYSLYRIARYCDELVDDGKNGLEPRYTLNTYFTKSVQAYKVLKDLLTNFLSMIYYIDGQILAVQDAPTGPVYTFSKANILNGSFQYESTGSQTRINQVIVSWNNPDNNYELEPLLIEDRVNIVTSGRVISQDAVAFGCTSEGQAIRYGRWKLWTAANQTEIVSFQTGINASFLIPGDVINVQDTDRDAVRYAGRISSATTPTTTQISIDSPTTLNTGSSYELSVIVAQPGAFLQQDSVVIGTETNATTMSNGNYYMIETLGDTTDFPGAISNTVGEVFQATGPITGHAGTYGTVITGTRYLRGALIPEAFTGSGSSAVAVTTKEIAANLRSSAQGSSININWNEEFKVETKAVTTSAGTVSALTVGTAFSVAPLVEDMWVLTETINGVSVAGSPKKYRILGISQNEENKYTIQAAEYYDEKFDAIEKDFTTYIPDIIYPTVKSTDVVPSPIEVAASASTEGNPNVNISWKPPFAAGNVEAEYEHTAGYEITHDIPEIVSPITINTKDKLQQTIFNVPEGTYLICIKTRNILGNFSVPVNVQVEVVKQTELSGGSFPENATFGGQFNRSVKINSNSGLFEVTNSNYSFSPKQAYSTGIINTSTDVATFKQATNGIQQTSSTTVDAGTFIGNHHYLIMDASDTADRIKLIKQYKDDIHKIAYWYDTGSGESGTPTILNTTQSLTGSATKPVGSKKVTGTGTAFTTEYKVGSVFVMPAANSEFVTGRVSNIESNTVLYLDNISEADATSAGVPRTSNFTIDNANDCIIGKVYKDTSNVYHFYSYASVNSAMEILGIESSTKSGTTTTVNLTDGSNLSLEDGTAGNNLVVVYADNASGLNASFTDSSKDFVLYHEYTGSLPALNSFTSGFVQYKSDSEGIIAVYATAATMAANATNKSFSPTGKDFVNFYEWTGTKPANVNDSRIEALTTFVKYVGDDATPLTVSSQSTAADGSIVVTFSDNNTATIPKGTDGNKLIIAYASNASGADASFTQGSLTFVKYHEYTGTAPSIDDTVFNSGFVKFIGTDATEQGIIAVYATAATMAANATNKDFSPAGKDFVNFYEWTGTKPSTVSDLRIQALTTFVKYVGDDATPLTVSSQSTAADGSIVVTFSDNNTATIPKGTDGNKLIIAYASNASGADASFTQGSLTFVKYHEYTGTTPGIDDAVFDSGFVKFIGTDATEQGIIAVYATAATMAATAANKDFSPAGKDFVNFYEWTGTKPSTVSDLRIQALTTFVEYVGEQGDPGVNAMSFTLSGSPATLPAGSTGVISDYSNASNIKLSVRHGDDVLQFNPVRYNVSGSTSVWSYGGVSAETTTNFGNPTYGTYSTTGGTAEASLDWLASKFATVSNYNTTSVTSFKYTINIVAKDASGAALPTQKVSFLFTKANAGADGADGVDFATGIRYEINAEQAAAGDLNALRVGTTQHSHAISAFVNAERTARWSSQMSSGYLFSGGTNTNKNGQWALGLLQAMSVTGVINTGDSLTVNSSSFMTSLSLAPFSITRIWTGAQIPANANYASSTYTTAAASGWSTPVVKEFAGSVIVDGTLKANSLIADDTFTRNLNIGAGGAITLTGNTGKIVQGKTSFSTAASGFFLGMDAGTAKFRVGNSDNTKSLSWDGSVLTIQGRLQGGDITTTAIPTGTNKGYYLDDDGHFFVGNASKHFTVDSGSGTAIFKGLNFTDVQGQLTGLTLFTPSDVANMYNVTTYYYTVGTIPAATTAYKPKVDVQFTIQNSLYNSSSLEYGYKVILQLKNVEAAGAVSTAVIISDVTSIAGINFKGIVLPGYLSKTGNHSSVTNLQPGDSFQVGTDTSQSYTITSNSYYSAANTTYIYYTGVNIAAATDNTLQTVATQSSAFVDVAEIFISPFPYLAKNSGFISGVLNSASTNATEARLSISKQSIAGLGSNTLSSSAIRNVTGTGEQIR